MENPATWGKAEKIVNATYEAWLRDHERGAVGLSLAKRITNALKDAGLMRNDT